MSDLRVVTLNVPRGQSDEIVGCLENLLERVRAGEFETLVVVAIRPDGAWMTKEAGKMGGRLRNIGIMESIKADLLKSSDTDEPSGL